MQGLLLLLFFLIVPSVELWILFQLSSQVSLVSILVLCGVTGALGIWLMRTEDFSLWTLLESEIQNRRMPTEELVDTLLLMISGVSLFIPGLFTDALGFALIFPSIRQWSVDTIRDYLKKYFSL